MTGRGSWHEELLPKAWSDSIAANPVYNALANYVSRPMPDLAAANRELLGGSSPIERIAKGQTTLADEYPEPNGLAKWLNQSDAHRNLGTGLEVLANVIGKANVKLPSGVKATHVSPHSFDRFDAARIGSGIGVQTEGRGLYFTDSKRLIDAYAEDMSTPVRYDVRINVDRDRMPDWDRLPASTQKRLSSPEGVADAVKAGIPGVQMKNAGRGYEGTSNYVIFDDSIIEILRKYGLWPHAVLGAASLQNQAQEPPL